MTTLNPLDGYADQLTFSNGNLTITAGIGGTWNTAAPWCRSTTFKSAGKVYVESFLNFNHADGWLFGLANASLNLNTNASYPGSDTNAVGYYSVNGGLYVSGAPTITAPTYAQGDTVGMAIDFGANKLWVRNCSAPTVWNAGGAADPASGAGAFDLTTLAGGPWTPCPCPLGNSGGGTIQTVNFGGSAFAATPPAGFSAWDQAAAVVPPLMGQALM